MLVAVVRAGGAFARSPLRLIPTVAVSMDRFCCEVGAPVEVTACCCCCWIWCSLMTAPFIKSCVVPLLSRAAVRPWVALFIIRLAVVGLLVVEETATEPFNLAAADETGCVGTRFGI